MLRAEADSLKRLKTGTTPNDTEQAAAELDPKPIFGHAFKRQL